MPVKPDEVRSTTQGEETPGGRDASVRAVVQGLRVVFRSVQEHSRWVEGQCGVSAAQLWAMWELFATPGMRVSDLSHALSIHQSTASNMLDKLERKGLIQRRRGGPDHRVVRLYLTDAGASLVAKAPRPAQGALTSALYRLPDSNLEQLHRSIADLVALMGIRDPQAALAPLSDD